MITHSVRFLLSSKQPMVSYIGSGGQQRKQPGIEVEIEVEVEKYNISRARFIGSSIFPYSLRRDSFYQKMIHCVNLFLNPGKLFDKNLFRSQGKNSHILLKFGREYCKAGTMNW